MVLNLTAGMGGDLVIGSVEQPLAVDPAGTDMAGATERLDHVRALLPEICTLDCGTMNFGEGNYVAANTHDTLMEMARQIQDLGVRPEIEVFDTGQLWEAKALVNEGLIHERLAHGPSGAGARVDEIQRRRTRGRARPAAAAQAGSMTAPSNVGRSPDLPRPVAVVGAGVIGAAWAARWMLRGVDVKVFDPSPRARAVVDHTADNARRAWDRLGVLPADEGTLTLSPTLADAVEGAELIHENVPEDIEIKRPLYREIESTAADEAVIASSTSGLRPTQLQAGMASPERFVVAHPFNPVYLLPMVEILGGASTSDHTIEMVMGWCQGALERNRWGAGEVWAALR